MRREMEMLRKTLGESRRRRRSNGRRGEDEERGRKATEKEENR